MEGDRFLSGEDVVTDDLLHLVADHIKDIKDARWYYRTDEYNFTDGPVKLPHKRFWKLSRTKFEVIFDVLIKTLVGKADCFCFIKDTKVNYLCNEEKTQEV